VSRAGRIRELTLAAGALLLVPLVALAQTGAAPYGRIPKAKVKKFVSTVNAFELEYPDTGAWKIVPSHPEAVLTMVDARNGVASIIVERLLLRAALTPEEIAQTGEDEAAGVRERTATAANVQQQVREGDGRTFITVQYAKPGATGPEQVVQYTFPVGTSLYRVICGAVQSEFPKYAPVFGHVAATFRAPPTATTKN
jgi:hypothetical protein